MDYGVVPVIHIVPTEIIKESAEDQTPDCTSDCHVIGPKWTKIVQDRERLGPASMARDR